MSYGNLYVYNTLGVVDVTWCVLGWPLDARHDELAVAVRHVWRTRAREFVSAPLHDLHATGVSTLLNPCHITKLIRTSHGNNKKVNSSLCSTCGAAQVSEHGIKHTQGRASSTRLPFVNKKKKLRMHCMCFHGMQGKQETGRNSQIIALRTLKQWQN
jgi:hypothetical protein